MTEALASWWGYDPEDATDALQAALDSGVKKLTINRMAGPWITRPLNVPSDIEILLADGVELLAKKGAYLGLSDSLLSISQRQNVILRGGEGSVLRMRKSDYHAEPYQKAEWRHGVNIRSSERVTIERLSICDTGGDGIYLGVAKAGVPCRDIVIRNVVCDGNNRQGISVISADRLLIEDCALINTSGTAPAAGIDFEPNRADEQLTGCVMRRCVFRNNEGCGIALYLPNLNKKSAPLDLLIEDCVTEGNRQWGFFHVIGNGDQETLRGKMTVRNCLFKNDGGGITIQGKGIDGHSLLLENVTVENAATDPTIAAQKSRSPILLLSRPNDEFPFGGMEFRNLTLIDPQSRPPISFIEQSALDFSPSAITGRVTLKKSTNDADADAETITLDQAYFDAHWPILNVRRIPLLSLEESEFQPRDSSAAHEESPSLARFRREGRWWLWGEAGKSMTFALRSFPVGKSGVPESVPVLIAPSGAVEKLAPLPGGEKAQYCIAAKETGVYQLSAAVGTHSVALFENDVPAMMVAVPRAELIATTGTYYFDVPEKTAAFGVKLVGSDAERVTATILDPSGREVWRKENIDSAVIFTADIASAPLPSPTDSSAPAGIWTLRLEKPTEGGLEDFTVALLGVPSLLTNEKRSIIVEKSTEK